MTLISRMKSTLLVGASVTGRSIKLTLPQCQYLGSSKLSHETSHPLTLL